MLHMKKTKLYSCDTIYYAMYRELCDQMNAFDLDGQDHQAAQRSRGNHIRGTVNDLLQKEHVRENREGYL